MADVIQSIKAKEKKIRSLQQEKARAEGQRSQLMKRLESEFGIVSVEEAIKELDRLQGDVDNAQADLSEIDTKMESIISNATRRTIPSGGQSGSKN